MVDMSPFMGEKHPFSFNVMADPLGEDRDTDGLSAREAGISYALADFVCDPKRGQERSRQGRIEARGALAEWRMTKDPKRPHDLNQWAIRPLSRAGRLGGLNGGTARAAKLSTSDLQSQGRKAAEAPGGERSGQRLFLSRTRLLFRRNRVRGNGLGMYPNASIEPLGNSRLHAGEGRRRRQHAATSVAASPTFGRIPVCNSDLM